jgi:tetratricopeptide (TPR) repeat protein
LGSDLTAAATPGIIAVDVAAAARLANGAARFLWMRSYSTESRSRLERIVAHPDLPISLRAPALVNLAALPGYQGDSGAVRQPAQHALALYKELGDKLGMGNALIALGNAASQLGEVEEARRCYARALTLFREVGERHRISVAHTGLANSALAAGDYQTAEKHDREVLALGEELADNQVVAAALIHLGFGALGQNRMAEGGERFSRSLELTRELDPRLFVYSLFGLAGVLATSDPEAALRILGAAEVIAEPIALKTERLKERWRERALAACRERLGEERLLGLWAEGRRMSADDVSEYALARVKADGVA